jgi:hypothetical protein
MKEINFIITCHNRESYWIYLKQIILSYKKIRPNIILCYNGDDENFKKEAQIVIPNTGHQHGEASLISNGFEYAKKNFDCKEFVKLSVDSWLLNENVILNILEIMSQNNIFYSGNVWNTNNQLSVDIFFINENFGNFLENFKSQQNDIENLKNGNSALENIIYNTVVNNNYKFMIIKDRDPVHPNNRFVCYNLGWTMSHELEQNLNFIKIYENSN